MDDIGNWISLSREQRVEKRVRMSLVCFTCEYFLTNSRHIGICIVILQGYGFFPQQHIRTTPTPIQF